MGNDVDCTCARAGFPNSCHNCDAHLTMLPLQYEDGPDYCTVRDARGRDFALTMQPDLMKAMEKALADETARFMRPPESENLQLRSALTAIRDRLWTDGESYDERIGDLKWLAREALERNAR